MTVYEEMYGTLYYSRGRVYVVTPDGNTRDITGLV